MTLWDLLPQPWQPGLSQVRQQIERIDLKLTEIGYPDVNPQKDQIFAALELPPQDVRVIIVGQDPYPNRYHAMGLAFSVPGDTKPLPPTLRNILRELQDDIPSAQIRSGDLSHWRSQGVLLLNRILTTTTGESLSHEALGWQIVTEAILKVVIEDNPEVIGVLWGNYAQETAHFFAPDCLITSVHPSPLSAHRGFFGSRPFSRVNTLLVERGHSPIHW